MEAVFEEAVKKCQSGQLEEFAVLYDGFVKKIYDFLYYRTRHKELAEDLTSVTFTKALEKIHSYKVDQGAFSTWIYRIARNTLFDHYRSNKPESPIEDAINHPNSSNVAREVGALLDLEKIKKLMESLAEDQREVIILRVWDGLSFKEIAEVLGKSEAASKMMYGRVIKSLQAQVPMAMLMVILLKP